MRPAYTGMATSTGSPAGMTTGSRSGSVRRSRSVTPSQADVMARAVAWVVPLGLK